MKRYIVVVTLVVALVAVAAVFAVMPAQHNSARVEGGQFLASHTLYQDANYTPPVCPLPIMPGCGGG